MRDRGELRPHGMQHRSQILSGAEEMIELRRDSVDGDRDASLRDHYEAIL